MMDHRLQENEDGTVERVGVYTPEIRPHVVEVYTEWWPGGKFKFGPTHEGCSECERLEIDDPVKLFRNLYYAARRALGETEEA